MKITDVTAMVLDTGKNYLDPRVAGEAHGVRFISLLKIETDEGITGWADSGGKAKKESDSRRELLAGRTLREVYDKYGVL